MLGFSKRRVSPGVLHKEGLAADLLHFQQCRFRHCGAPPVGRLAGVLAAVRRRQAAEAQLRCDGAQHRRAVAQPLVRKASAGGGASPQHRRCPLLQCLLPVGTQLFPSIVDSPKGGRSAGALSQHATQSAQ